MNIEEYFRAQENYVAPRKLNLGDCFRIFSSPCGEFPGALLAGNGKHPERTIKDKLLYIPFSE